MVRSEEQRELLELLAEAWSLTPSQRLGQLIVNVSGALHGDGEACAFGVSDSRMQEGLVRWCRDHRKREGSES